MPYPQNIPSLTDLAHWPIVDIAELPADALAALQKEADEALGNSKASKAQIDNALIFKYADASSASRRAVGKDTGTVRIQDGAIAVVADAAADDLLDAVSVDVGDVEVVPAWSLLLYAPVDFASRAVDGGQDDVAIRLVLHDDAGGGVHAVQMPEGHHHAWLD